MDSEFDLTPHRLTLEQAMRMIGSDTEVVIYAAHEHYIRGRFTVVDFYEQAWTPGYLKFQYCGKSETTAWDLKALGLVRGHSDFGLYTAEIEGWEWPVRPENEYVGPQFLEILL